MIVGCILFWTGCISLICLIGGPITFDENKPSQKRHLDE